MPSLSLDIGKLTKSLDISVCVLCDSLLPLTCWYHSFSFCLNVSSSAFRCTGPFKRSNSFCYLTHLYQLPSSSSSSWGATTSEKFWPSQRVSSIWSGFWCSPSRFLFASLLYRSLHHPPIYFLGLPSDLVSAGDHSYTFCPMLLPGIRCTCPNQTNLCALM